MKFLFLKSGEAGPTFGRDCAAFSINRAICLRCDLVSGCSIYFIVRPSCPCSSASRANAVFLVWKKTGFKVSFSAGLIRIEYKFTDFTRTPAGSLARWLFAPSLAKQTLGGQNLRDWRVLESFSLPCWVGRFLKYHRVCRLRQYPSGRKVLSVVYTLVKWLLFKRSVKKISQFIRWCSMHTLPLCEHFFVFSIFVIQC